MDINSYLLKELAKYDCYLPKGKVTQDAVDLFIHGSRRSDWTFKTAKTFTNKFPEKIKGKHSYTWFLLNKQLKWCKKCNEVLKFVAFNKCNKLNNLTGLQSYCVECVNETMTQYPERGANQRAKLLKATPSWVDINVIKDFYKKCPEGYHVDHIIPLKGVNVCGLHVPWNLQYLTAYDNLSKSNKYTGG